MKPAKKIFIINLTFLLTLSSVNATAFAIEPDHNDSSHNNITASASAVITDAEDNLPLTAATDLDPLGNAPDQTADKPSIIKPPAESNPGIVLTVGQEIAVLALKYNGFKYVYGAASPSVGFDCSGFAYYIYKQFGYALPRTAHLQYGIGASIEKSDLQAGDLVFFATYEGRSVTHVGIYIGHNEFINAATTKRGVMICSLDNSYWAKAFVGAKRIIGSENTLA